MPLRPPRLCAGRCGKVGRWTGSRCPACARIQDQRRGTASARGYDADWVRFRPQFIAMLVDAGIAPVCGAILPGGPVTEDSDCKAQGLQTFQNEDGSSLHFDHEPPLADDERRDPLKVCDPLRIQLLCRKEHSRKTLREGATAR